ncbi:hypothetical protein V2J09_010436 [Rumex salicifolius]
MSNSFAATIAVVFLLIVSVLASPASAVPISSGRLIRSPRIVIPDHSAQVGFRFWGGEKGGRKLLSRVHTDDYDGTGANGKHDPSTGREWPL